MVLVHQLHGLDCVGSGRVGRKFLLVFGELSLVGLDLMW